MHTIWKRLTAVLAGCAVLALAACTGTDYGGSNSTTPTTASATGIWGGTDSSSGQTITGFVDASGLGVFIRADGVQFVGPIQVAGTTVAATVVGYTSFPSTFSDGSTYGLGTLNGTVASGSTLTLTLTFTTNGGTAVPGAWSLSFNTLTNNGSSLGAISANYTDSASGSVVTITSSGAMTSQNAANGCVLNGSVTVVNSAYDIYEVSLTYEDCTAAGGDAPLNGVQFTGLAVLDPNASPAQVTIAVAGTNSSGDKYSLVLNLAGS
jgi:hypothetical protein